MFLRRVAFLGAHGREKILALNKRYLHTVVEEDVSYGVEAYVLSLEGAYIFIRNVKRL